MQNQDWLTNIPWVMFKRESWIKFFFQALLSPKGGTQVLLGAGKALNLGIQPKTESELEF